MTIDEPIILIRADSVKKRADNISNYQDTLNQKLFFSKPSQFHQKTVTDGNNTGMVDETDGSMLSNPISSKSGLILDRYILSEEKSNLSLYNLSYIGVKKSDITDKFDISHLSRESFTNTFIEDIKTMNIANGRGLSYISINDFTKLTCCLNKSSSNNTSFRAQWICYDQPITTMPKKIGVLPYKQFLSINFSNLSSKEKMHEFRFCLQTSYCSENGKLIDYSNLTSISFKKMDNVFS